jgi:basic membrane protein A
VVGAIGVAQERGIPWFGTQANQTSLAPTVVVACQVYDWTVLLDQMIALIKDGTYGGEAYVVTLENEGLLIEFNDDYDLPAEVKTLGEQTIQGIKDGSITVDVIQ